MLPLVHVFTVFEYPEHGLIQGVDLNVSTPVADFNLQRKKEAIFLFIAKKFVFVLGKANVCLGLLQPPHAFIIIHATYWRSIKYVHIRPAKGKKFGLPILPWLVLVQNSFCHPAHV